MRLYMIHELLHKLNNMDDEYQLEESFEIHNQLNPQLFEFDGMIPEIRTRLVEIADMFVSKIQEDNIPIKVLDYWLVGSNAQYNYGPKSDIDIHVIVNMEQDYADPYIIKLLYDYIKSDFNNKYDIEVKGHEVELYIEDVQSSAVTNGIYSLKQDKWIKVPIKEEPRTFDITTTQIWSDTYSSYENLKDEDCEEFLDKLYVMRKISLANDGEWGEGNLVFKEFRNRGYIEDLRNRKYKYKSKELTLENLQPLTEYTQQQRNLNKKIKRKFKKLAKDANINIVTDGLTVHHLDDNFDENNIKDSEWDKLYLINAETQAAATLHKIIHYKNNQNMSTLKDAFNTLLEIPVYQYDEKNERIVRIKLI